MVFWGLGVRMVYVLHVTWMINSVTHMWGSRRYETTDDSRNLWWVGLLGVRRGLAQQPSRLSTRRQPGSSLVGDRRHLLHDLDDGKGRPGVGRRAAARYSEGHEARLVFSTHFQRSSKSPSCAVILRKRFHANCAEPLGCFDLHF